MSNGSMRKNSSSGFTIVELLIVVVVIAILAAIGVVAYTGIQNRAYNTTVQADLRQIGNTISQFIAINNRAPTFTELEGLEGRFTKSAYSTTANAVIYCHNVVDGIPVFAVGGVSRADDAFYYSTQSGGVQQRESWGSTVSNLALCPLLGVPTGGSYAQWWIYNSNGSGWLGWTANY